MTLYVNVYEASRCYGGPEEGGWWFDTGYPILSIPVALAPLPGEFPVELSMQVGPRGTTWDEATRAAAEVIRTRLREDYPNTGKRSSVIGGDDYDVLIEKEPGKPFPETFPRYE